MQPRERLRFSPIAKRAPLRFPDGIRLVVWPVLALEEWDISRPMARMVISPPQGSILDGISLRVTRELCAAQAIPVEEETLTVEDCFAADEALLTSTPYGVAGVSCLNGHAVPWPGPVLSRLQRAWNDLAGLDIARQITGE